MFALTPSQLKRRVLSLAAKPQDRFLELAMSLEKLHGVITAGQFKEVVQKAGLGTRKAYYLVNIAGHLRPHMRFRSRLQKVGWTKCQIIGRSLPGANISELIEYAENHSAKELTTFAGKQETSAKRCVLLYFTPSEYQLYEKAVRKFGAEQRGRGLIDKEKATVKMARKVLAE